MFPHVDPDSGAYTPPQSETGTGKSMLDSIFVGLEDILCVQLCASSSR